MRTHSRKRFTIIVYVYCILYITIFSRIRRTTRIIHLLPFWSFSFSHWNQFLLNIALFIPLGFFLMSTFHRKYIVIILSFSTTFIVELTQFLTYRGMFDIDDIISNCCGAAIGFLIQKLIGEKVWKDAVSAAMLTAGLIGCIIVSRT